MLTREERNELRVHYTNRFRGRSFEGNLEVDQTQTKEYEQVDRRIKNLEAELSEARNEMYELNQAFDAVSREERIRVAKQEIGIRDEIEALVQEVFDRTQVCTKLQGDQYSYRHELPGAYATVSSWIKRGEFGRSNRGARFNKLFVEYDLVSAAARIMSFDSAKKSADLSERVWSKRSKLWEEWSAAGHPRIDEWHCVSCDAECAYEELNWKGQCPTCESKEIDAA